MIPQLYLIQAQGEGSLEESRSSQNIDDQVSRTWEESEELSYFKFKRKPQADMLHYFKELIKMVERKGICIYMGE